MLIIFGGLRGIIAAKYVLLLIAILVSTNLSANNLNHNFRHWAMQNKLLGTVISINGHAYYYGYTNKKDSIKVDANTVFGIGSITKTFTSVIILQLEQAHQLNINNKITQYFPRLKKLRQVTIRDLLQMNAGFNDIAKEGESITPKQQIQQAYTQYDAKNFHHWRYSNVSYQLLGKLIEKVTHHSLADNIRIRITTKLKMKHTYFPSAKQARQLYEYQDGKTSISNYQSAFAAGGLVSNTADLTKFIKALFVQKRLLAKTQYTELIDFIKTPASYYAFTKTKTPSFGLGVFQWQLDDGLTVLTYPGVLNNGFASTYIVAKQQVIILQTNTYNNDNFTLLWPYQPFVMSLLQA